MNRIIVIQTFLLLITFYCGAQKDMDHSEKSDPYFGQERPGLIPNVFASGLISTKEKEHSSPTFSIDGTEMFWSVFTDMEGKRTQVIKCIKKINRGWSEPQIATFSGKYFDGGPCFSPDGERLYFYSKRGEVTKKDVDIWFVERCKTGWSEPKRLGNKINTPDSEGDLSFASNGNLYYSGTIVNEGGNRRCILFSEYVKGSFSNPQKIEFENQNSLCYLSRPCIAEDESFIILSNDCRKFENGKYLSGERKLAVSFKKENGTWGNLIPFDSNINSNADGARHPRISPDGEYLFFTKYNDKGNEDIYWVDIEVIYQLK